MIVYCSCVMYADDLIPVSASVNLLQRMIDTCCEEAVYLDMKFNPFTVEIRRTQLHSLRGIIFRLQRRAVYARSN